MILIDDTVISSDIADEFFVCDLAKCKGACCVEGTAGAPLEKKEAELPSFDELKSRIAQDLYAAALKQYADKVLTDVKIEIEKTAGRSHDQQEGAYGEARYQPAIGCVIVQLASDEFQESAHGCFLMSLLLRRHSRPSIVRR